MTEYNGKCKRCGVPCREGFKTCTTCATMTGDRSMVDALADLSVKSDD